MRKIFLELVGGLRFYQIYYPCNLNILSRQLSSSQNGRSGLGLSFEDKST